MSTTKKQTWSALIKALREKRKLSQTEAADKWQVAPGTLRNWEQGRFTPNPIMQAHYLGRIRAAR